MAKYHASWVAQHKAALGLEGDADKKKKSNKPMMIMAEEVLRTPLKPRLVGRTRHEKGDDERVTVELSLRSDLAEEVVGAEVVAKVGWSYPRPSGKFSPVCGRRRRPRRERASRGTPPSVRRPRYVLRERRSRTVKLAAAAVAANAATPAAVRRGEGSSKAVIRLLCVGLSPSSLRGRSKRRLAAGTAGRRRRARSSRWARRASGPTRAAARARARRSRACRRAGGRSSGASASTAIRSASGRRGPRRRWSTSSTRTRRCEPRPNRKPSTRPSG